MVRWGAALIVIVIVLGAVPADAQVKKARKTLNLLTLVDGVGSGLDADRVQGMTPADIVGAAGAGVGTALAAFLGSAYSRVNAVSVSANFCNTVDVSCDGDDFLLNCGGSVDLTAGYLTEVTELLDVRVCRAGGCGDGSPTAVAVTATCLVR